MITDLFHAGRRRTGGQALIEIFFVIILFFFIGIMAYETGVVYYNLNQVSNALKQGVWLASLGATDEDIVEVIGDMDTHLLKSIFMEHTVTDFAIEVWVNTPTGDVDIAPTTVDNYFSPGTYTSSRRRAAYIWRANGLNIRLGLNYKIGYVSPYFGLSSPVFMVELPLSASQPIVARNDDDHDGMVDLYEREFLLPRSVTYTALCHTDSGGISDKLAYDIDRDAIPDTTEAGFAMYDMDNDYIIDPFDPPFNQMRHPKLGGNPLSL